MHFHPILLFLISASSLTTASFFSDILRSLLRLHKFSNLIQEVPQNLINDLENNEQQAGEVVCDILAGNVPAFLQDVVSTLSSEAESDFESLVGFVQDLPKLAPEILGDLEQDAGDVVSVIGELATNPGAAITVIVGGVESVVEDIWSETIGGEIITGIECFFGDCPTAAVSTPAEILALQSSCLSISAAAARAPTPTTTYIAAPTTAATTALSSTYAVAPTTIVAAVMTTVVVVATTSQEPAVLSSKTSVKASFPTTFLESTTAGQSQAAATSQAPHPTSNNSHKEWSVDLAWMAAALIGTGFVMRFF